MAVRICSTTAWPISRSHVDAMTRGFYERCSHAGAGTQSRRVPCPRFQQKPVAQKIEAQTAHKNEIAQDSALGL